ncbi:MAG: hypothetical protein KAX49_05115 [Halanaerobiales bacterium]|nr:hypothetical protein [Halanaerobiales bacterium]
MSNKETNLNQVVSQIQEALKDKDIKALKEDLLQKLKQSDGDVCSLVENKSVQDMLKPFIGDANLADLLKNKELNNQLCDLLYSQSNEDIIDKAQEILKCTQSQKKK